MKKIIVITSIFSPTKAVELFAKMPDHSLIVVGDEKTVSPWDNKGAQYLSLDWQLKHFSQFANLLPTNHYSRKMIGYLRAMQMGADLIIDADDDILPKKDWAFPAWEGGFPIIRSKSGFVNIYQFYTSQKIWPRGLPLQFINDSIDLGSNLVNLELKVGIWQGLSDENPDVDAIYRLTNNANCIFSERGPVVLEKNAISPFNSQNTSFRKELFALLYLPAFVSFRFTDILRGLVAQPIMWLYDYHLGFTNANTVQVRNPHDHFEDFKSEISMYYEAPRIVDLVLPVISKTTEIGENLFSAYRALEAKNIVKAEELIVLEGWLRELENL